MDNSFALALLVFGILLLIISLYYLNKPKKQLEEEYNKVLSLADAKCGLICRYIDGLPELTKNISCYLLANDEKIVIIPIDNTTVQISLQIFKIKSFQYIMGVGIRGITPQGSNNSITIHYISDNEIKEITFSLVLHAVEVGFNKIAISKCNINAFINERIPKQETTIDL